MKLGFEESQTAGVNRKTRGLDRVEYPAQPRPGFRQDSDRAKRCRSREGFSARGMAEDAFPQE
jgi:hypothetical protein